MLFGIHKKWWLLGLFILACVLPLVVHNAYYMQVVTMSLIWVIAAYGLNIILGYTGQLSLAHAGFLGIGAYTVGLLTVKAGWPFWPAIIAACALTTVIGFFVGLISLRTKGHYFAIFTLCVGVIINLVIEKWDSLTEGVRGLIGIPAPNPIGPIRFDNQVMMYYLVLFFVILTIYIVGSVVNSLVGRTFVAIRNSEDLSATIGINVMRNKILAFMLSTCLAGLAGGLYSAFIRYIGPEVSGINTTFDVLLYLLVGGVGTIGGPVVGTLLVAVLSEYLQKLQEYRMVIFGPLLVLLVMFFPGGIVGQLRVLAIKKGWYKAEVTQRRRDEPVLETVEQVEEVR
jgi:branched-chain amino acid transport system permease protein